MLLVVCATHGSGDIPTNILPLVETLERERPDLSGHRYGIIALGDMPFVRPATIAALQAALRQGADIAFDPKTPEPTNNRVQACWINPAAALLSEPGVE